MLHWQVHLVLVLGLQALVLGLQALEELVSGHLPKAFSFPVLFDRHLCEFAFGCNGADSEG